MKTHWRPAVLSLAALPAVAAANTPTAEPLEPLAHKYLETTEPHAHVGLPALEDDPKTFKVSWRDGLAFETNDKQFRAKIGGRIQHDWAFFSEDIEDADPSFDFENGAAFRRVRLYLEALLYQKVEFKAQLDFVNDSDFADVYVGYLASKCFNVRVGQFKEPFGLDELTSSNYIAFMERPSVLGMGPARNTGVMLHGASETETLTYGIGVFKDEDAETGGTAGVSDSGEFAFTARVTGLPVYEDEGQKLVHLGVAGSLREPRNEMFDADFSAPTARGGLSPSLLRNTAFMADRNTLLGVEAAAIVGPWWGQAEYMMNDIDADDGGSDASINGYYLATGYFLTGETRGYKKSTATFDKVKTKTVFGKDGGTGAFEVALRYGMVEFDDVRAGGGGLFDDDLRDITLGFNWYLNTNTRVMFNVVDFDLDANSIGLDEGGTAYMTRFQVFL